MSIRFKDRPGAVFNSGRQVALGKKSLFFNEGELSPGGIDRIKQTMFSSDFKQSDKGTFTTTVDADGSLSDLLYVTGKADLQGGTVRVREINLGEEAVQKKGTTSPRKYRILIAKAGVSGRFSNVISSALTEGRLDYGSNEVYLSLKKINFCDLAQTDNEKAVACKGLDKLSAPSDIVTAIRRIEAKTDVLDSYNDLSGVTISSIHGALMRSSQTNIDLLTSRLKVAQDQVINPLKMAALKFDSNTLRSKDKRFWGVFHGEKSKTFSVNAASRLETKQAGLTAGFDDQLNRRLRLSIMVGHARNHFSQKALEDSGRDSSLSLGIYGLTKMPSSRFCPGFGGIYNWHNIRIDRLLDLPDFPVQRLSAHYRAHSWQGFGEVSYNWTNMRNTLGLEPFAAISHINFKADGFRERGGSGALKASSSNYRNTFSTLEIRSDLKFRNNIQLHGTLGWRHTFNDINPPMEFAFANNNATFSISGTPVSRNSVLTQLGARFIFSPNMNLSVSYKGQYAKKVKIHGGDVQLKVNFQG